MFSLYEIYQGIDKKIVPRDKKKFAHCISVVVPLMLFNRICEFTSTVHFVMLVL